MSDYQPNKVIPGTVYQVIQLLGQGGMGTVYEVEDTTVGKRYVLKTLHAELRDRKELAARLHKEARTLARLSHPNIVEVVTAGMTADALKLPYFVMQKLNGHTLRSVLSAKGCLPLETAYSIAIDLLDALDHAHSMGVIHRDVKPENIFLHRGPNETHQTKLLDFGVMRMLSSDQTQTGARFVGTLRYAPPEQLRGGEVTPRNDLYAAGLVLYEMIAGGGPFDDEITDRAIASAHMERRAPLLATRARVPPALDVLVESALSKDPAGRPRDAFTFASRLRAISREAAQVRGSASSHGTLEAVLGGIGAPLSATNLEDPTEVDRQQSRARATTLENAHPPATMPQNTLRMDALNPTAVDRSAPTRTSAPMESVPLDRSRTNATTTGATESHVSDDESGRKRPMVAWAIAAIAVAAIGITAGARWMRARTDANVTPVTASARVEVPASTATSSVATTAASSNATVPASPPSVPTPAPTLEPAAIPAASTAPPAKPVPSSPPAAKPRAPHRSPTAPSPASPPASTPPKSQLPPIDL